MSAGEASAPAEESKVLVGDFVFNCSESDLKIISEKIGDVLEAQVILRGSEALGYGHVRFVKAGENAAAEGEIAGNARLLKGRGGTRGGRGRGRGARRGAGRVGGRVRRSADDPEGDDAAAGSEEAAQNGQTSVKAVTDQVAKEAAAAGSAATPEAKVAAAAATGRGGKTGRGRGAKGAKSARPKRERGEPSKTLVFIRNIPYSYDQSAVEGLLKDANLSYSNLSIPVWNYGLHKGQGRGFVFVTATSEEEQAKIIEALNGKELTVSVPAAEGEQPKERQLRLQARHGYDGEVAEKEHEGENGATDESTVKKEESVEPTLA